MKTTVGLWIDHRKAVIVALTDEAEEIKLIISTCNLTFLEPERINTGDKHFEF
jgi:hypothetical protein